MLSFQNEGLHLIFINLVNQIKICFLAMTQMNSPLDFSFLATIVKAFQNCVSFNFNLSYFEYESYLDPLESNMICVKFINFFIIYYGDNFL